MSIIYKFKIYLKVSYLVPVQLWSSVQHPNPVEDSCVQFVVVVEVQTPPLSFSEVGFDFCPVLVEVLSACLSHCLQQQPNKHTQLVIAKLHSHPDSNDSKSLLGKIYCCKIDLWRHLSNADDRNIQGQLVECSGSKTLGQQPHEPQVPLSCKIFKL